MQTTGAVLLAVRRCSPVRMRMLAHDSRSAYGLLYFAAVWPVAMLVCVHACGAKWLLCELPGGHGGKEAPCRNGTGSE
jgi:hypothetical protein